MSTIKRRGTLLLLVMLSDSSRSFIPASWTDWNTGADGAPESAAALHELCVAPLADLLRARVIVDTLLSRCLIPQSTSAADEEGCHATFLEDLPAQPLSDEHDPEARSEAIRILAPIIAAEQKEPTDE